MDEPRSDQDVDRPDLSPLYSALAAAQAMAAAGVEKGGKNDYHRYKYATAEAIIGAANAALAANGLALLSTAVTTRAAVEIDNPTIPLFLIRHGLLTHKSGLEIGITGEWPIVLERGRPLDKAMAGATTSSLGYLLRDLLLMPRVDPSDDMDHSSRDQQQNRAPAKRAPAKRAPAKRKAKPVPPAPEVAAVAKATHATPTKAKPPHDPNWSADRPRFCAAVEREGYLASKVFDWCEEIGKGRPSWWTREDRGRFVRDLKADKIQPPPACEIPKAKG